MYSRIKRVIATHTFRQSIVTVISTFATAGLGAVFYLLLARLIGSHEYGLFSVAVSLLTIIVTFTDVGMGQGLVKFVAENSQADKYQPYVKIALFTKIVIGFITGLALWIFAKPLAVLLLRQPEVANLLPIAGWGIFSIMLFSLSIYVFQGLQKFVLWGGLQIGANIFRLLLFGLLFLLIKVNSAWGVVLFVSAPLFGFLLSWVWLPAGIVKAKITSTHWHKFWNFNKWTAAFSITATLASRLDTLLTARFLTLSQTGVYAMAITMVAFLPQLSSAIGAVTAPKFASFSDSSHSQKYLAKAALFSFATSVAVALAMIPAALVVVWFIGRDFSASFAPFLILLLSLAIFTSLNPIRDSILYFYKRPQFFFWANLLQGLVIIAVGSVLIPLYGVIGTALSALISHVIFAGLCLWEYENCRAHHS
ncbi:MAG: Polysaccharide biosynthesis protein [Candidatus Woesebacteria bacterium GW2011_GWB1_38_5b]|uniref:Polysaccharide biosynthesis protein n=1 Tax=Candidatus Woesebacteria bacterium GW2011_GWB1_38_5b TaxID=1618569 RepID=A0A0G0NFK1_9BACT|nr:MAG: Polysaccharide biosynthesis protein [Candidatus Woesebacteria bacterium GW2011_GWB1_38_5b]